MINLLPPEIKQDIVYGRRNSSMVHWAILACASLLITVAIMGGGYLVLKQSIKAEAKNTEVAQSELQTLKIEDTQKQVEELTNNTKLVIQVLSKEILFSKLLTQLGSSIPANTTLTGFQIDKLQGALTLKGTAKDVDSATQLQLNLQDPQNKIFEKADIESIACNNVQSEDGGSVEYPCTVQIRALFSKNNPFTYISKTTSNGGPN